MKIYIASSWKNREQVRKLAVELRAAGHEVYDFTDPSCRKTHEIPPEKFPKQFDPEKHNYKEYLVKPEWESAVLGNLAAIEWAELIILLLPCGIDSTADWAAGIGMGKFSIVVGHPAAGERHPVHLWADEILNSVDEVIPWIKSCFQ